MKKIFLVNIYVILLFNNHLFSRNQDTTYYIYNKDGTINSKFVIEYFENGIKRSEKKEFNYDDANIGCWSTWEVEHVIRYSDGKIKSLETYKNNDSSGILRYYRLQTFNEFEQLTSSLYSDIFETNVHSKSPRLILKEYMYTDTYAYLPYRFESDSLGYYGYSSGPLIKSETRYIYFDSDISNKKIITGNKTSYDKDGTILKMELYKEGELIKTLEY